MPENRKTCIIHSLTSIMCMLALASCMGREARPIAASEAGDAEKSCGTLAREMLMIEQEILHLESERESQNKGNAFYGVTGALLFVPLLFMDVSPAERQEQAAYRERYRRLSVLAAEKNCGKPSPLMPKAPQ